MNLYEFSQQNNNEMGIYINKETDLELYNDTFSEAQRLLTISEEIRVTVQKIIPIISLKTDSLPVKTKSVQQEPVKLKGYCIRTGVEIPFNIKQPLCDKAFDSWAKFNDSEYAEKFCHFSGESSKGETCYSRPILKKNWKKAKAAFNL